MKTATKTAGAVKWHGGKSYLAPWIISQFPKHTHYVEPYFGGGAVLFAKPEEWINGHSEDVNDLNGELINFWQVVADRGSFDEFVRVVAATPCSEQLWDAAVLVGRDGDPIRRAVAFFVRNRQSRQGLGEDFATLSRKRTRSGMNELASAWWGAIDGLPAVHERLRRVVILKRHARKVITTQDGPETLFYLDPPYLHETRSAVGQYGPHEMTDDDHRRLLETLEKIAGRFILSGYPSALYNRFAKRNGWRCEAKLIDNKASGAKTKAIKTECLWMNF